MSRQYNCRNKTEAWPHMCRWHLEENISRNTRINPKTQCHEWIGWKRAGRPSVYLKGNTKIKHTVGQANHIAWWLKHGERVDLPYFLKQTCGTKHCINPDHRQKSSFKRMRTWSMREVKELREEYWGTEARAGNRIRNYGIVSPIILTSFTFGVSKNVMYNFVAGKECRFSRWPGRNVTREMVQKELDKNTRIAKANQAKKDAALTMQKIADRWNIGVIAVSDMLRGHTYKSAGGPTGPVRQVAHKLKVA